MSYSTIESVVEAVQSACPGAEMVFGKIDDKSTWRIRHPDTATPAQIIAAERALVDFDTSPKAEETRGKQKSQAKAIAALDSVHPEAIADAAKRAVDSEEIDALWARVRELTAKVNELAAMPVARAARIDPMPTFPERETDAAKRAKIEANIRSRNPNPG